MTRIHPGSHNADALNVDIQAQVVMRQAGDPAISTPSAQEASLTTTLLAARGSSSLSRLACIGALLLGALATTTTAVAAEFRIRIGNIASTKEAVSIGLEMFKYNVEKASGGRIEVQHFPAGQLGNFRQMVEQVQLGTLEMTFTTGGGIGNVFPPIQAFDLPYLMNGDRVARLVSQDDELIRFVRGEVLKKTGSLRLLQLSNGGRWRSFYTTKGPIRTPADLKGMKIRIVESPIQQRFIEAIGASPAPIPWPELYTAFSTGIVQGTGNAISGIVNNRFDEFVKHGVLDNHSYVWEFWWVNEAWWKKLPPDLRAIVMENLIMVKEVADVVSAVQDFDGAKAFEKKGGQIRVPTAAEMAEFRKVRDPVVDWYVKQNGDAMLKALQGAVTRAERRIAESNDAVVR